MVDYWFSCSARNARWPCGKNGCCWFEHLDCWISIDRQSSASTTFITSQVVIAEWMTGSSMYLSWRTLFFRVLNMIYLNIKPIFILDSTKVIDLKLETSTKRSTHRTSFDRFINEVYWNVERKQWMIFLDDFSVQKC